MRRLFVCALIVAGMLTPARADNVGNSCSTRWSNSGVCSFLLAGEKISVFGVALTKTTKTEETLVGPAPLILKPYLTVEVVWRHTDVGGATVDTVLLSCAGTGAIGVPAIACSASAVPKGLELGTPLLCTVRGRELGAIVCSSAALELPAAPSP